MQIPLNKCFNFVVVNGQSAGADKEPKLGSIDNNKIIFLNYLCMLPMKINNILYVVCRFRKVICLSYSLLKKYFP